MRWQELVTYIPVGEAHAIHMKDLAARLGTTAAGAKAAVRRARPEAEKEKIIIASSSKGYFIADGVEELKHYCFPMQKQGGTRFRTVRTVKRLIDEAEMER